MGPGELKRFDIVPGYTRWFVNRVRCLLTAAGKPSAPSSAVAAFWIAVAACILSPPLAAGGIALRASALPLPNPGYARKTIPSLPENTDIVFRHVDQDKGLTSPIVTSFAEDGEGLLWIGTQSGIARWDGYRMRTYQMKVGAAGSLPDNIIKTLFTDSSGVLWVGTNAGGLVRYDKEHDRFTSYPESSGTPSHGRIADIVSDQGHGLWIGTDIGLDHFDPATGVFTHFHGGSRGGGALLGKRVTSLVQQADGRLWVGTSSGLFQSDAGQENFTPVAMDTPQAAPAAVLSLLLDDSSDLWIGTLHGAFVLKRGTNIARVFHEAGTASPLDNQKVSSLVKAGAGMIWLGTFGQGIISVNTKDMTTYRIRHDIALPTSLSDDTAATLYRDRAGTVWVGTRRGANSFNTTQAGIWTMFGGSSRTEGIASADVFSVLALKDGRTWLGLSNKGIDIFDASWMRVRSLRANAAHPATSLPEVAINALEETPEGHVYVGTSGGLYRAGWDGSGLIHVPVQPESVNSRGANPHAEPNISTAVYHAGRLWIGTDNGLWTLDSAAQDKLTRVILQGQLTGARIILLGRGQGNDLWVGTESGLNRVDLGTMKVEPILPNPRNPVGLSSGLITSMVLDSRARLWVGTMGGGINLLESRDKGGLPIFRRLMDGLPNGNIDTLLQANDGSIWAATDDGLAIIDSETFAIRPLRAADGLGITAYWNNAGAKSQDGTIVLGGVGGLTLVKPGSLKSWNYIPPVVVTEMRVGGKAVWQGGLHGESTSNPVQIKPESNRVEVEFAALDYTAPGQNQYSYRLNGYDKDWVAADPTQRLASYTNLPPGAYTLLLRGSNRAGVWAKAREVHLLVLPAWHQTLWFHMFAGLLALIGFAGVYQGAMALSRRRQRELESQVVLRTAELQESQRKLEEMAFSDTLTGLPNRRMFTECFNRLMSLRQREAGTFALLLFDLDGFKGINDTYGHDTGDAVLKSVATRLKDQMRDSDCFARLGGDEFSILLSRQTDAAGVELLCERVIKSFVDPVMVGDLSLRAAISVGAAMYPAGGDTQDELYKSADLALYRAKRGGKNGWSW